MKKVLLVILLIFSSNFSYSQTIDTTNGYSITDIINSDLSSKELYIKAKEWFAINFKSSNDVIQLDVPNEKIIGKGISQKTTIQQIVSGYNINSDYSIPLLITIDIKENKYRYKIETTEKVMVIDEARFRKTQDSIISKTPGGWVIGKKMKEEGVKTAVSLASQKNEFIKNEISSLKNSLLTFLAKKNSDNW